MHDPDRRARPQQVGEQIAACLRRVVDRNRLAGEQERPVEVLLDERLGTEALGELGRLRVACLAALDDGEHASRERRGQQDRDPGQQRAKTPVRAPGPFCLLFGDLAALGDEVALELVQVERVIGGPFERRSEAGAAVKLALIAPCRAPFGRRLGDVVAKPAPFSIPFDPLAQARPFAQQRLVGDLDGAIADGDEAAVGQRREHVGQVVVALEVELGEGSAAAHRRLALALADQAQHDRPHQRLAPLGDAGVGALGQPRDGAVNAAGLVVGSQRERVVLPLLPELEQCGGQQRQRAWLALHVVDQRVGQLRLHPQPHPAGGQLDDTSQLRGLHRTDQDVVRTQQLGKSRVGREPPVEVGAQRDHYDRSALRIGGRASKGVGERSPLGFGAAGGEQLLELVDDEQEALVRGQRVQGLGKRIPRPRDERAAKLVQRPLPGAQQQTPPPLAARQDPSGEGREKTGADEGRLAAARRSDDAQEADADEAGDELGDEPLAAEEILGIHRLEARETLERADPFGGHPGRGGRVREGPRLLAHDLEVGHLAGQLGLDFAQVAPPAGGTRGDIDEYAARLVDHDREPRPGELSAARVALPWILRQRPARSPRRAPPATPAVVRSARAVQFRGARTRPRSPSHA